jgi:S-methylmethionine-dependent homocysteine/selenocysteine methylase
VHGPTYCNCIKDGRKIDEARACAELLEEFGAKDGMTFAERLRGWKDAGAGMIGGCCRTKPEDIQKVSELSQNL